MHRPLFAADDDPGGYRKAGTPWWGEKYVAEWCAAGVLRTPNGEDGRCRVCCGRGFVKCSACRARGTSWAACDRCQGRGAG